MVLCPQQIEYMDLETKGRGKSDPSYHHFQ